MQLYDDRPLSRWTEITLSLLRMVAGLLFVMHGGMKMFGWFGGSPPDTPLMQAAGLIETIGGTMIMLGLFTRPIAFLASGEMAFAYFMAHAPRGMFSPIENHGENAVLFCFIFLFISAAGPGPFSLDALMARKREPRPFLHERPIERTATR